MGGQVMRGTVLAENYERACFVAAKSFPIVVEVIGGKKVEEEVEKVEGMGDFWK
jgi:hypothetical protein